MIAPSQFYVDVHRDKRLFDAALTSVVIQPPEEPALSQEQLAAEHCEAHRRRKRSGRVRALFLGQIAEHKGIAQLGRAALASECTDLRVAGPAADSSGEQLADIGATVLGPISGEQKWREIAQADVVCVPSTWPENAPQVVEEAFVAGVPVLASRTGGLPERVHDDANGILVPASDERALTLALRSLAKSDRCIRLSEGASKSAHRSDIGRDYVEKYEEACEIVGGGRGK